MNNGRQRTGIHNPNAPMPEPNNEVNSGFMRYVKGGLIIGLAYVAGVGTVNHFDSLKNRTNDLTQGGGIFEDNGQYAPAIYRIEPSPNNNGGLFESDKDSYAKKGYGCLEGKLVFKHFKAQYEPDTPYTDPDAIASIENTKTETIPGLAPECKNNSLDDDDAKYKFWRKRDHILFAPDFLRKLF